MTLREVLQIEIWSKETSRRITRSIWKVAKPVGVVSGILVVLLGPVYVGDCLWLTSGERQAGRAALVKLERLEQLEQNGSSRFDVVNGQAKASIATAQQKAWTIRDRQLTGLLEFYRWQLETDHESRIREIETRTFMAEKHLKWHSNPDLDKRRSDLQVQLYSSMSSLLHKELD